ncbi:ATP-binding protein [Tenacibaculum sp.]|uniref:ATP-binding protein n=1 Tax=Tenacibaculum sp. TaxID=1906242 RepID=UPI003D0BFAE1
MALKRHLTDQLHKWKSKPNRKPLILRGARQVGKTTLVNEFAKTYKHHLYLNLEKKTDSQYFEQTDDVNTIIESLLISNNIVSKDIGDTLLFIDEIQEQPKAIQLLRYFYEDIPDLHVIAAGSLLEFALKDVKSFPVGRVEFLYLYPFNFMEYMEAIGHHAGLDQLKNIPVKPVAHKTLLSLFNDYTVIGGMPEVVDQFIKNKRVADLSSTYESIWSSYISDSEKYAANTTEKNVIKHIMLTAAYTIDERIKFQNFGNSNYRSREVGEAMRNLHQAKVIQLIYPTTATEVPIVPDLKKSPRLQFLDTGILNHILGISADMLVMEDLSQSYKGAIIPHVITQELISIQVNTSELPNFWVREKKQASSEVDLVYAMEGKVIPIEIKSGSTGSLKSLHQFIEHTNHPYAIRIYAGEFSIQETKTPNGTPYLLMNLPYYLGTLIPQYISYFIKNHHLT